MKIKTGRKQLFAGLLTVFFNTSAGAATLQLELAAGLPEGVAYIAVHASDASGGWGSEPVGRLKEVVGNEPKVLELELEEGAYAIRAFIDVNENEELDLNGMGYPREPVAYSRSEGRRKPSRNFKHAVIALTSGMPAIGLEFMIPKRLRKVH